MYPGLPSLTGPPKVAYSLSNTAVHEAGSMSSVKVIGAETSDYCKFYKAFVHASVTCEVYASEGP